MTGPEIPFLEELRDEFRRAAVEQASAGLRLRVWTGRPRVWMRRAPRRRPAQVALAGVALAAVLLAVALTSFGGAAGPASAAAAALQRLARIVASGPSLVPGPGQYLYERSVDGYPATYPAIHGQPGQAPCVSQNSDRRQVWIAADGSGYLRDSTEPTTFSPAADRARCQLPSITTNTASTSNLWFAAGCWSLGPTSDMDSLSTDPSTLLSQMRTIEGGPDTPAEDFVHVGDFLRETDASPALRAALYNAAALIPGVKLLGTVQDHFGRQGLGVALSTGRETRELIFNSRTAALMGEQTTGGDPRGFDVHPPPSTGFQPTSTHPGPDTWSVYLDSKVVDSQPERSPVPLTPACGPGGAGAVHGVPGGAAILGGPAPPPPPGARAVKP